MIAIQRKLNVLFIFILCGVLLSAYTYQFTKHEIPCSLCNLQRLSMIGIALGLLLNFRFTIRAEHYAFSLLSALFGLVVSLKQIGLHVCPQFPRYGENILGHSLFFWSFVVFICSIFSLAVLLILWDRAKHKEEHHPSSLLEKAAALLVCLILFANMITSFINCGFGYCQGI